MVNLFLKYLQVCKPRVKNQILGWPTQEMSQLKGNGLTLKCQEKAGGRAKEWSLWVRQGG